MHNFLNTETKKIKQTIGCQLLRKKNLLKQQCQTKCKFNNNF